MSKHTFNIQNPSIYLFAWTYYTHSYVKLYAIYLNTTNFLILNMHNFIYWVCIYILNCSWQVIFQLCQGSILLKLNILCTYIVCQHLFYHFNNKMQCQYLPWKDLLLQKLYLVSPVENMTNLGNSCMFQ